MRIEVDRVAALDIKSLAHGVSGAGERGVGGCADNNSSACPKRGRQERKGQGTLLTRPSSPMVKVTSSPLLAAAPSLFHVSWGKRTRKAGGGELELGASGSVPLGSGMVGGTAVRVVRVATGQSGWRSGAKGGVVRGRRRLGARLGGRWTGEGGGVGSWVNSRIEGPRAPWRKRWVCQARVDCMQTSKEHLCSGADGGGLAASRQTARPSRGGDATLSRLRGGIAVTIVSAAGLGCEEDGAGGQGWSVRSGGCMPVGGGARGCWFVGDEEDGD